MLTTLPTQNGARTIAIDRRTHHLFLPSASFGPAPAATKEHPHPRPPVLPGSLVVLDVAE